MTLKDILSAKGDAVEKITSDRPLDEVARRLIEKNVGSLIVYEADASGDERVLGIITERDITRVCAKGECSLCDLTVASIMTTDLVTGSLDDKVENVMGLMTERRFRHLPILSEGRLVGLISIGDLVKAQYDRLAMENRFMKDYIRG